MGSGHNEDFEPWPDMNPTRLLDMFPESELVKIYAIPLYTAERTQSWESLGVTDPVKQAACEIELDQLIAKLAKKNSELDVLRDTSKSALRSGVEPPPFEFIWGK